METIALVWILTLHYHNTSYFPVQYEISSSQLCHQTGQQAVTTHALSSDKDKFAPNGRTFDRYSCVPIPVKQVIADPRKDAATK